MDIKSLKAMQEQFRSKYNQKVKDLTLTFQACMDEMKKDYERQLGDLEKAMEVVAQNHKIVGSMHQDQFRKLESEKSEIQMERQKLVVETNRLKNLKAKNEQL